jgi:hypothetical protein
MAQLVEDRVEGYGDGRRFPHMPLSDGILQNGVLVVSATLLRIVRDMSAIKGDVKIGRDEPRQVPHRLLRRPYEKLDELFGGRRMSLAEALFRWLRPGSPQRRPAESAA